MDTLNVQYCPWCGGDVDRVTTRDGHRITQALECPECEKKIRVEQMVKETRTTWDTAF